MAELSKVVRLKDCRLPNKDVLGSEPVGQGASQATVKEGPSFQAARLYQHFDLN